MSNLIPEKRVNKHGVAVTKHVRSSAAPSKGKAAMPAPALSKAAKSKGKPLTKNQLETKYHSLLRSKYKTDPELREALLARYGHPRLSELDVFTCSEAEVYDVISVVGLVNAGALLDAGLRSKDDALGFLRSTGLDRLASDSTELTTEALNRGISSSDVFYMYRKSFAESEHDYDIKLLLDSAEAHSHKGLRELKPQPPVHERVALGVISMDDLRVVGPTRFVKALDNSGFLLKQLIDMKSGILNYDAEQMKETILRYTSPKGSVHEQSVRAELWVAGECGYEFASGMNNPQLVARVVQALEDQPEDKMRVAEYTEIIGNSVKSKWTLSADKVLPLFAAGVDPMRAVVHLDSSVPVEQIIAIEAEGIAPSVSGGWL